MAEAEIVLEQTEILEAEVAAQGLDSRMSGAKSSLGQLQEEIRKRGYRPSQGPRAEMAVRQTYRAREAVEPDAEVKGAKAVQELSFELFIRGFEKADSEDEAAIATVRIQAGDNIEEYDMLLEAPRKDYLKAVEYMVEDGEIKRANSWWSAVKNCLASTCATVCLGSLVTCSGTLVAYVLCVLAGCGGCGVKCTACATCNCRWWCRWAAGCCRQ